MPCIVSTAERWDGRALGSLPTSLVHEVVSLGDDRVVTARPIRLVRDDEALLGIVLRLFRPTDLVLPTAAVAPANDAPPAAAPALVARRASTVSARAPGIAAFISAMVDLLQRDLLQGAP